MFSQVIFHSWFPAKFWRWPLLASSPKWAISLYCTQRTAFWRSEALWSVPWWKYDISLISKKAIFPRLLASICLVKQRYSSLLLSSWSSTSLLKSWRACMQNRRRVFLAVWGSLMRASKTTFFTFRMYVILDDFTSLDHFLAGHSVYGFSPRLKASISFFFFYWMSFPSFDYVDSLLSLRRSWQDRRLYFFYPCCELLQYSRTRVTGQFSFGFPFEVNSPHHSHP